MSLTPSRKTPSTPRRRLVGTGGVGGRYSHSDTSSMHTYPCRVGPPQGSPTARTHPSTPRRQMKHTACSNNHGIKVPAPEQYLTPLQQKEVCIRHLRARLRENVERLQHRDFEIEDLRTQLYKMQEDWIEEECHRVEAQLALKEARREIQQLQEVVESVRSNLGMRDRERPGLHKPHSGLQGARPAGGSRSCGCSPANTLRRGGAGSTRQSSEALQLEQSSNPAEVTAAAARSAGQNHLLLEATLLSEQLPQAARDLRAPAAAPCSLPSYDRLCPGGGALPVTHSCLTLGRSGCMCAGHTHVPHHHHLFLHLPQEEAPPPAPPPPTPPDPISVPLEGKRAEVRSQACSPTMTWLQDEELSVISPVTTDCPSTEPHTFFTAPLAPPLALPGNTGEATPQAHVRQPQSTRVRRPSLDTGEHSRGVIEGVQEDGHPAALCHWSRYFLVDLMALAMPVVPTVAWLCRGAPQEVLPVYHIGSLLRGCCAVALHSLRRRGAGEGSRRASVNGAAPT